MVLREITYENIVMLKVILYHTKTYNLINFDMKSINMLPHGQKTTFDRMYALINITFHLHEIEC